MIRRLGAVFVIGAIVLTACRPTTAASTDPRFPTPTPTVVVTELPAPSPTTATPSRPTPGLPTGAPTATSALTPVVTRSPPPPPTLSATPTEVSPGPTPGAPLPPTPAGSRTVTLADAGQTIDLQVGQAFLLALDAAWDWTVSVADPSVVNRLVNVLVVRGAQGIYVAKKAGRTILTAVGDPPCRKARPACALPSRVFRITVVVR